MVGTLDEIMKVGIISTIPPIRITIKVKVINKAGLRSKRRCHDFSFFTIGSKGMASAGSLAISFPCFMVFVKLKVIRIAPAKYKAPPAARIMYIGRISKTVVKKFGYFKV